MVTPIKPPRALTERDMKALRVFRAAAQAGGFAAAERQLCMTRSAISKYIRDAEESLGVRLCERGPKGFVLLEAGEAALRATGEALEAVERIRTEVEATKGIFSGSVSIGVADNLILHEASRVPQALRRIVDASRALKLDVMVASPLRLKAALLDGHLHLMISAVDSDRRLSCTELFTETVALYRCPPAGRMDRDVSLPLVMRPVDEFPRDLVKRHGFASGPVATDLEAVAVLVCSGAYMGMLPIHYADLLRRRFALERVPEVNTYARSFGAIVRKAGTLPRAVAELLRVLVEEHAGTAAPAQEREKAMAG